MRIHGKIFSLFDILTLLHLATLVTLCLPKRSEGWLGTHALCGFLKMKKTYGK